MSSPSLRVGGCLVRRRTVLLLCGPGAAATMNTCSLPPVVDLQLYVGWQQQNRRRDETIHHKISGLLIRIRKRVLSFSKESGVRRTNIIEIRLFAECLLS